MKKNTDQGRLKDKSAIRWNKYKSRHYPFIFSILIPLFLIFFIFNIWPVLQLFNISFRNWPDFFAGRKSFIGFENYRFLFSDPTFIKVLKNTFSFTILRVPLGIIISLLVALGINNTKKMRTFYIGAFFSPFVTSVVGMSIVFVYFYHPIYGLFNFILREFGLPALRFLNSTSQALPSIALVDLWKEIGFPIVIFLAGLQVIPDEYYEAAAIDGANNFQIFRFITLPLLAPTTYLLLLTTTISTMRVFTPIFVMTSASAASRGTLGGPLNSTNVIALYSYQQGFQYQNFSLAAAASIVLFLIVVVITILQLRMLRVKWEY